jgi:hypothetical protein
VPSAAPLARPFLARRDAGAAGQTRPSDGGASPGCVTRAVDLGTKPRDYAGMVQSKWGSWGAVRWGLCAVTAFTVMGCGSSDDKSSASNCGTILSPDEFTLSNIQPALGSSVPNSNIVHSFTIDGQLLRATLAIATSSAHTAGDPTPALTFTVTASASGQDSVYTADPVTWAMPGHVELIQSGDEQNTTTGCVSYFPSPLFSYDVTAPAQ